MKVLWYIRWIFSLILFIFKSIFLELISHSPRMSGHENSYRKLKFLPTPKDRKFPQKLIETIHPKYKWCSFSQTQISKKKYYKDKVAAFRAIVSKIIYKCFISEILHKTIKLLTWSWFALSDLCRIFSLWRLIFFWIWNFSCVFESKTINNQENSIFLSKGSEKLNVFAKK